jgi:hypothetical protein
MQILIIKIVLDQRVGSQCIQSSRVVKAARSYGRHLHYSQGTRSIQAIRYFTVGFGQLHE